MIKPIPKIKSNKPDRKKLDKECLKLWRELGLIKAKHKCEYQGCNATERLNAHHFFSKGSHSSVRHEINNCIILCYLHHKGGNSGAHCDPFFKDKILGKYPGFKPIRTEQWLTLLERQANASGGYKDLYLVKLYLENEIKNCT
jgi:hypothetical protein